MAKRILKFAVLAAAALTLTAPARAETPTWGSFGPAVLRRVPLATRPVSAHFFHAGDSQDASSLLLTSSPFRALDEDVRALVHDALGGSLLELRAADSSTAGGRAAGTVSRDYAFFAAGMPLCGIKMRAHRLAGGETLMLGAMPDLPPDLALPSAESPDWSQTQATLFGSASSFFGAGRVAVVSRVPCLYLQNSANGERRLEPVWKVDFTVGELPYHATVDARRVLAFEDGFFSVDGQVRAFLNNRLDPRADLQPVSDLVGDGTLTTDYITTVVPPPYVRAEAKNEIFDVGVNDRKFDELQAFFHVGVHFAFARAQGFQWYGSKPLAVTLHTAPQGIPNNALYVEAMGTTPPRIVIDDGDGEILQNLASDSDVVSHEFGHHIIFQTLKQKFGESLVLHEGLADFFVFARTGDACLGESICPPQSAACQQAGLCLRTGTNPVAYLDDQWTEWYQRSGHLGHLHGQMISGLLWGLVADKKIPAADVTKLVFRTVSLFGETSGLRDFALALLTADHELFAGKYFDTLRAALDARNLSVLISDVKASTELPPVGTPGGTNPITAGASVLPSAGDDDSTAAGHTSRKKTGPLGCGAVGVENRRGWSIFSALALLLPLGLVRWRRLTAGRT